MNSVFAVIVIIGGVLGALIAWRVIPLEKWLNPGDVEDWHDRYGKIFKIAGPIVAVIGLLLLIF